VSDLDEFRAEVRAFIDARAPRFPVKAGVRSPETEEDQEELRRWTRELFDAGYLGADWPVEYGGSGTDSGERDQIVAEELARAFAPLPPGGSMLAAAAILGFGTAAQKATHLPAIRSGSEVWCQLFSEPDAGSDLAGLRTRAVLAPDGSGDYLVTGQKVWTTNGQWADFGYLLARTDPDAPKHRGITAFAMDMRSPGLAVRPLREMTGTADFNEVFLDQVRVPASRMIGSPGQGWAIANSSLAHERSGVAANVVTLRELWRALWDQVSGTNPDADVRQRLLALHADVEALAALVQLGTERWRAGVPKIADAPMAKLMFSEVNLAIAETAVELLGPDGIFVEGDSRAIAGGRWQDAYLYARAYTIAGGSSEIMRNVIAERGLGLPR